MEIMFRIKNKNKTISINKARILMYVMPMNSTGAAGYHIYRHCYRLTRVEDRKRQISTMIHIPNTARNVYTKLQNNNRPRVYSKIQKLTRTSREKYIYWQTKNISKKQKYSLKQSNHKKLKISQNYYVEAYKKFGSMKLSKNYSTTTLSFPSLIYAPKAKHLYISKAVNLQEMFT